jgi:hypothetical protein
MATVYCAESGFSGPNLYHDNIAYFVYAGVAIEPDEAEAVLARLKGYYKRFQGEVKFSSLVKKDEGLGALDWLLKEYGEKAKVWFAHKKFATAGKFFEYVIEPIVTDLSQFFYFHDFHRFVANILYVGMLAQERRADELLSDLQHMVKERNTTGLKRLLGTNATTEEPHEALDNIAAIAVGYRDIVLEELGSIAAMGNPGVWMMDLTVAACITIARAHAEEHDSITIYCDDSKPLKEGLDTVARLASADLSPVLAPMGWNSGEPAKFAGPITLVKASEKMAGVQIADLFAGMAREVLTNETGNPANRWRDAVWKEVILQNHVKPEPRYIDPSRAMTRVNGRVLAELAWRARAGENPIEGMIAFYECSKGLEGMHLWRW